MKKTLLLFLTLWISSVTFSQTPDAEVIDYITSCKYDNKALSTLVQVEIKINSKGGDKYSTVSIPMSGMEDVKNISAFLKDKDGNIVRKLKKKDIVLKSDISNFSFYEDSFVNEFSLMHNDYPYSIVYSYEEIAKEFLYLAYWSPVMDDEIPTRHAVLSLDLPSDYLIRSSENLVDSSNTIKQTDRTLYFWEAKYEDIHKKETFAPVLSTFWPSVKVVPEQFTFGLAGSFKSWEDYGKWQSELISGLSELPESEKNKISKLVQNVSNEREKIKILYYYLQKETRYVNISIDRGGMKPHSASYVSENKYGDCKALSNYFTSILDFVGIDSYYTKIYAGEKNRPLDLSFPSQQFNHIIVFVPQEEDTIWLDCTSEFAFGYLGTFTQDREAFVINNDKSTFVRTPALTLNDVQETRVANIKPNVIKEAEASFDYTYKGDLYETLFYIHLEIDKKKKFEIIQKYFLENGFSSPENFIITPLGENPEIKIRYQAKSKKIYNEYNEEIVIKVLPFDFPDFESPKNRHFPVQLDYPIFKTDTLNYDIPLNNKIASLPKEAIIDSPFGVYQVKVTAFDSYVQVIKSFALNSGYYPLDEYNEFYQYVQKAKKIDKKLLIITRK